MMGRQGRTGAPAVVTSRCGGGTGGDPRTAPRRTRGECLFCATLRNERASSGRGHARHFPRWAHVGERRAGIPVSFAGEGADPCCGESPQAGAWYLPRCSVIATRAEARLSCIQESLGMVRGRFAAAIPSQDFRPVRGLQLPERLRFLRRRAAREGDAVRHQAFGIGPATGLQFHLELTRELIETWTRDLPAEERQVILNDSAAYLRGSSRLCEVLVRRFLMG